MKMKNLLYAGLIAAFALTGCSQAGTAPSRASQAAAEPEPTDKAAMEENTSASMTSASGQSRTDAAAASAEPLEAYHKITAQEAKEMIDNGGVTIVDVRRPDEYSAQHIPGAVNVPNEDIGTQPPAALPDQDAVLLVHCRTGIRSKAASDKLVKMGYQNVYDFGGIVDWPYETE